MTENGKVVYLVAGAEASGTRMMTRAIVRAGVYGQSTHGQTLDWITRSGPTERTLSDLPNKVAFRRTLPHANEWPDLDAIAQTFKDAGYSIHVVVTIRGGRYNVLSQVRAAHVPDEDRAIKNIEKAELVVQQFKNFDRRTVVPYRAFVTDKHFRNQVFESLGLIVPADMVFYNGDRKYDSPDNPAFSPP